MTIDEAIVKLNSLIQLNICPNLFNEIIEWLKELKTYKEYGVINKESFDKGYNKAIDDIVDRIFTILPNDIETRISSGALAIELSNIAERLKDGVKNEIN